MILQSWKIFNEKATDDILVCILNFASGLSFFRLRILNREYIKSG